MFVVHVTYEDVNTFSVTFLALSQPPSSPLPFHCTYKTENRSFQQGKVRGTNLIYLKIANQGAERNL
jgi:hypothetical protein